MGCAICKLHKIQGNKTKLERAHVEKMNAVLRRGMPAKWVSVMMKECYSQKISEKTIGRHRKNCLGLPPFKQKKRFSPMS